MIYIYNPLTHYTKISFATTTNHERMLWCSQINGVGKYMDSMSGGETRKQHKYICSATNGKRFSR